MRSWAFALALAPAVAVPGAQAAPAVPAVLSEPALQTQRASDSAMLALARAGTRLVAAGERGIVMLSDDDGATWRQATVPVQTTLTALHFVDARTGWAVGHLGVILRTDDGGDTWRKQLDGTRASALMAQALKSTGDERLLQVAQRYEAEGPDKPLFDIDFSDAQHGIAVGAYNLAFATADGGASWTPLAARLPNPRSLHLYAVSIVAGQVFIAGEQGLLMRSKDGGSSFEALPSPYKGSLFGLLATRNGALLAFGLRGNAYRSSDRGGHWEKVDTGITASLNAGVEMPDGALALLAQTGTVLLSRDDGRSFSPRPGDGVPVSALVVTPKGQLLSAGLRGLRREKP